MKYFLAFFTLLLVQGSTTYANQGVHFQIGSKFERSFHKNLDKIPSNLHKAALSVAQFGSSTAFYVGKHNGKDIMVTTAHSALSSAVNFEQDLNFYKQNPQVLCRVFLDFENSPVKDFQFNLLDEYYNCKALVAIFPELDLAFFELESKNKFDLSQLGIKFSPPKSFKKGEPFSYFSYSGFANTGHILFDLGYTKGELCTPLVNSSKIDYIESYDDLTKESLKIPTIPIGCDAAPGDSGSPLLDEEGLLVGILWSVSNSNDPLVSNQDYLTKLIKSEKKYVESERSFVWKNFNYASSLQKSIEEIRKEIKSCESVACKTLKSIVSPN